MSLTPADVHNKEFTVTRIRPGYDEDEVDAFLEEVESELERLLQENEELRSKLSESTRADAAAATPSSAPGERAADAESTSGAARSESVQPQVQTAFHSFGQTEAQPQTTSSEQSVARLPEPGVPTEGTDDDTMQSASRMLALAQQTADQAVSDARREADETIGKAQREAEQTIDKAQREAEETLAKTRRQAEQIMSEARSRAEALERDAQERHRQSMGTLVQQREDLERKVDDLRAFEREYRSRLKAYLEGRLRDLEAGASEDGAPQGAEGAYGESGSAATSAPDARNGQPGGVAPGPSGPPMSQTDTAQHAGSGLRAGPDSGPQNRR